jgi:predicted flap endonuclease-1-like 5' DNA nuclease
MDAESVSLTDLRKRIEETDLVPSRVSLLDGIIQKIKVLEQNGVTTLARLRKELKNSRRLEALSRSTGIDMQYLILLRREIESYFPKPPSLRAFDWLPDQDIVKLEEMGIRNVASLYEAALRAESLSNYATEAGVDHAILESLVLLADLTRVQWVSPTAARMLLEAGYTTPSSIAAADPVDLCDALERINEGHRFFKGRIGLRDIKRLVRAASYVPD